MKYSGIGGQAVLEGIMMKNKDSYAVAVRKADGEIAVMKDTYVSMTDLVRGLRFGGRRGRGAGKV